MNWSSILAALWAALNSPAGIAAVAGFILWLLNKLYAKKPAWEAFEGSIIAAVKFAEKEVPDDTENKSLARFDAALRYVIKVYEQARGKSPSEQDVAELKEGINLVHDSLETQGTL